MQAFDLAQAQRAVQEGLLAPWQLNQALKVFQMRQNPSASLIEILIELRYLKPEDRRPGTERYARPVVESHLPRAFSERRPAASSPASYPPRSGGVYGSAAGQRFNPPTDRYGAGLDPEAARRAEQRQVESSGRGTFGRYELRGVVARGGMGTVYQAFLPELDKVVALKALNIKVEDEVDLKRFMLEARAAARLRHPNIVPVHDIGQVGETRYFTMDLVQGKSLDKLVHTNGTYDAIEAARIGRSLGKALSYAHAKGIIHRDIKPGNILVEDKSGEPFVTDFGLARTVESSQQLTKTGFAVGTPNYMAPEQATGSKDLDERADVYGLGALLYSIVTGRPPFQGPNALATMTSVINDPVPSIRSVVPEAPEILDRILRKAMAKSRRDRYPSMDAFVAALDHVLEPAAPPPARELKPWIALAAAALVLGAGGFFGFRAYRSHRQRGFLLSSARLARVRGRFYEAEHFLDQAARAGVAKESLDSERSALRGAQARSKAARDRSEKRAQAEEKRALTAVQDDARQAEDKGDWARALRRLSEGLEEKPDEPAFLIPRARLLMRLGKESEALAILGRMPQGAPLALLKGRLALLRDHPERALEHLQSADVEDPEARREGQALCARALALLGRSSEARDRLGSEATSRDAERARLDLALATADWSGAGRIAGRLLERPLTRRERGAILIDRSWARLLGGDLDGAGEDIERGVREVEGPDPSLIRAIHIQISLRRIGDAQAALRRLRAGGQNGPELQIANGRLQIARSIQAAQQKQQQQALRFMRSGAQQIRNGLGRSRKPQPVVVYTDLSQACLRLQQFPQALEYARKASQLSPNTALTDSTLFGALQVNGRSREALEVGRRASAAQPGNFALRGQVIELMIQSGANEEALKWIVDCPQNWQQNWQLRFKKARALKNLGREDEARTIAEGLLQLPDNIHSWAAGVEVCLRFGLEGERLDAFVQRLAAAPVSRGRHLRPFQNAATFLEAYGELEHYQTLIAKIEEIVPNSPAAVLARARADYQRGDFEACRSGFRAMIDKKAGDVGIYHGMIGLSFLAEGALEKAADFLGRARKSQVRAMALMLRLFCLKQSGAGVPEAERQSCLALIGQLKGNERYLAPALQYMLEQKSAEAIEGELRDPRAIACYKLARGLECAYQDRGDEARALLDATAKTRGLDPVINALARHVMGGLDK